MRAAGAITREQFVRSWIVALLSLMMLAWPFGWDAAVAEPIQWADVAPCYDRGVHEHKPIVILLFDRGTSGVGADTAAIRLSLSPRIQAVAAKAVWCFGDVSKDVVSRNFAKALKVKQYPSVSVLAPNGEMLDEAARIYDLGTQVFELGSRADLGFEEAAEKIIVQHIEQLSATYGETH